MRIRLFISLITALCVVDLVNADPTTKPSVSPPPVRPPAPITLVTRPTISPQEWLEFSTVRAAVMKANPDLVAKARALEIKMRALNIKITAAMLKEDPHIAPVVSRLDQRPPPIQSAPQGLLSPRPSPISSPTPSPVIHKS